MTKKNALICAGTLIVLIVLAIVVVKIHRSREQPDKYNVFFVIGPHVETDDGNAPDVLVGRVNTPFTGNIKAAARRRVGLNDWAEQSLGEQPTIGIFHAIASSQYTDVPYEPGNPYLSGDTLDGLTVNRNTGDLTGVPISQGTFHFLPAIEDPSIGPGHVVFEDSGRYSGLVNVKQVNGATWMTDVRSETIVILPAVSINDENRVGMRCDFENQSIGSVAMIVDYGANFVEVARHRTTKMAGLYHLKVNSKTLLSWASLPVSSFSKNFANTLSIDTSHLNVDQVNLDLDTGELTMAFQIGALRTWIQDVGPKEVAHCTRS
jgi:hypothetical protein